MTVKVEFKPDPSNPDVFSLAFETSSTDLNELDIIDRVREAILNPDLKIEHAYIHSRRWVAKITRRAKPAVYAPV